MSNNDKANEMCNDVRLAYTSMKEQLVMIAEWKDKQIEDNLEMIIKVVQQATTEGLYTKYIVKRLKELLNIK